MRRVLRDICAGLGLLAVAFIGAGVVIATVALAVKVPVFGYSLLGVIVLYVAAFIGRLRREEKAREAKP